MFSKVFSKSPSGKKKKRGTDENDGKDPQQDDDNGQQQAQPQEEPPTSSSNQQQEEYQENDEERAARLAAEHKVRLIEGQRDREQKASEVDQFAKQQRVRYFHKLSDQWIDDAVVVGVHHDDGPDKPYYTIRYTRPGDQSNIEKQTTEDRLQAHEFDPDKSWAILEAKTKR